MRKTGFLSLLRNRNFMFLWGEQVLSQFAYNLVNFALIVWVFKISGSSFAESLLILSFILPTAIFSVLTGLVADLFDRRKIMLLVHGVWAIFVLLFIFIRESFALILFFSFLLNAIDRFFTPAEQASLPKVVSKNNLMLATSLFSFSLNAGFLLGFSLSGPLMLFLGNDAPFFLASFLAGIGLIFVWFLPPLLPTEKKRDGRHRHLLKETILTIKDGYRFVREMKIIFWAIVVFSIFSIGMNTAIALFPSYVVQTLGFPDPKHASFVVMFPVGMGSVLAIILLGLWRSNLKRVLIWRGILLSGIALLGLALAPLLSVLFEGGQFFYKVPRPFFSLFKVSTLVFFSSGLLGLSGALIIVPVLTIISQYTPNEYLGRVWGVANLIQNTSAALPLLVFGIVADQVSVLPLIFAFAFLSLFLYTLINNTRVRVFFRTHKEFRGTDLLFPVE